MTIEADMYNTSGEEIVRQGKAFSSVLEFEKKVSSLFSTLLNKAGINFSEFYNNPGKNNPYHNNLHQMTVALMALFIEETEGREEFSFPRLEEVIDKVKFGYFNVPLFVACAFHDYNHSAGSNPQDLLNIFEALSFIDTLKQVPNAPRIKSNIAATEYPFIRTPDTPDQRIIRDADILCGVMYPELSFYNQYMEGLRKEVEISRCCEFTHNEWASAQIGFLDNVHFFIVANSVLLAQFEEKYRTFYRKFIQEQS